MEKLQMQMQNKLYEQLDVTEVSRQRDADIQKLIAEIDRLKADLEAEKKKSGIGLEFLAGKPRIAPF